MLHSCFNSQIQKNCSFVDAQGCSTYVWLQSPCCFCNSIVSKACMCGIRAGEHKECCMGTWKAKEVILVPSPHCSKDSWGSVLSDFVNKILLELIHKKTLFTLCFWTMVLEKSLESPLDCKEIKPVNPKGYQPCIYSLEGQLLKLRLQYFGHVMQRANSLEKTLCWGRLKAKGEGDGWRQNG